MKPRLLLLLVSLWLLGERVAFAQTPDPAMPFAIRLLVLDAQGEPVSEMGLEVLIFQYGPSVEAWYAGACETDSAGGCVITAVLPPSIAPDWYEGVVYVETLGRQMIGWRGPETLLTIQLAADGRVPTESPFLHPPYETQPTSPTDVPLGMGFPTETPRPTETLAPPAPFTPEATHPVASPPAPLTPPVTPPPEPPAETWQWGWLSGLMILGGGLLVWIIRAWRKQDGKK